jgi:DNA-binding NarL/FixJ family response regulator
MPVLNGLQATRQIIALSPKTKVLVLSAPHDVGGGAGVQQATARPPLPRSGRVVASASERKADAEAGGSRMPEREPGAKRGGWPRPARRHMELLIKSGLILLNYGNPRQSKDRLHS